MPSAALSRENDYKSAPAPAKFVLTREIWDAIFGGPDGIGPRLRLLEDVNSGIERIKVELINFGQQRLDEAIVPLITDTQASVQALQTALAQIEASIGTVVSDVQEQADEAIAEVLQNVGALQQQIDTILAGGIPAANVQESAEKSFISLAEKLEISQLRQDLADLADDVSALSTALAAIKFSSLRPLVFSATNVNLTAGERRWFNTSAAARIGTLPAAPATGDTIDVARLGANAVTIARNGKTIAGLAEDLTIDADKTGVTLMYVNGGWRIRPWSIA